MSVSLTEAASCPVASSLCGSCSGLAGENGRTRTVHFGAAGASDYTQHRDPVRKQRYLARHAPREDWTQPMTAGALARWILWVKETLHEGVAEYLRRFALTPV